MIRVMTTFGADGSRYTRLIGADGRVVIERSAATPELYTPDVTAIRGLDLLAYTEASRAAAETAQAQLMAITSGGRQLRNGSPA